MLSRSQEREREREGKQKREDPDAVTCWEHDVYLSFVGARKGVAEIL